MNFDNAAFKHRMPLQKTAPAYEKLPMKRGIFFDMFPFSVIFHRDMIMYRIGDGLKEVFSDLQGKKVNEEFTLIRPMLEFNWENVSLGGGGAYGLSFFFFRPQRLTSGGSFSRSVRSTPT